MREIERERERVRESEKDRQTATQTDRRRQSLIYENLDIHDLGELAAVAQADWQMVQVLCDRWEVGRLTTKGAALELWELQGVSFFFFFLVRKAVGV